MDHPYQHLLGTFVCSTSRPDPIYEGWTRIDMIIIDYDHTSFPDDYDWSDDWESQHFCEDIDYSVIDYYDQPKRLSFQFLWEREHDWFVDYTYEEGFIYQGPSPHEFSFELRKRSTWSGDPVRGYSGISRDIHVYRFQEKRQIFRLLNEKELTSARKNGLVPKWASMALVEEAGFIYYPTDSEERDIESRLPWRRFS